MYFCISASLFPAKKSVTVFDTVVVAVLGNTMASRLIFNSSANNAMLLRSLDCAHDVGISAVKKEIAALESALQKLSEQEEKYSAELDEALKQYAELKEQAAGMDAVELMDARLAVREEQERSVANRVKSAYGEKYDPMMMQDSKRDVANLLNEETEARSIRERLRQKQQAQQKQNKKKSRDRWER